MKPKQKHRKNKKLVDQIICANCKRTVYGKINKATLQLVYYCQKCGWVED